MTRRPKVLLAPVTVTPSKPLTPSHLKGLLWMDVMYRATAQLADVTYRYSPSTYHVTEQTLGFWEYLDRTQGDTDYSTLGEEEIGALYVRHRAEDRRPSAADLRPYAEAAENNGWVHPAGARVLRIWREHYARLGMHDPGLLDHQSPGLGLDETIDLLLAHGLGLDQRDCGGPVYLDATRFGLPLRQIVTPDGRPNYLACALRELLALAPGHDEVVLAYDRELDPDYQLLERAVASLGPVVHRVPLGRVPINGTIASARHGGWRGHTVEALLASVADGFAPEARRLGMRLYFIAALGPGDRQSFRADLMRKCLARAEQLIGRARAAPDASADAAVPVTAPAAGGGTAVVPGTAAGGGTAVATAVAPHRRGHTYVDPYRLTSSLLGRGRTPAADLLSAVYL